jgi:hypothetical protein
MGALRVNTNPKKKQPVFLQALAGVFLGVPFGVWLYYMIIYVYYLVFLMTSAMIGPGAALLPPVGAYLHGPAGRGLQNALNYGPACTVILAACAVTLCLLATRKLVRSGYKVFALAHLPLALPTTLALFYLMFIFHKPLIPFYGQ